MGQSIVEVVEKHIAANKTELPVFDGTSARVREILEDSDADVSEIEKLIASDPVIATALLRVANSSFFGGLDKVASTRDAFMRLGASEVANIVMLACQKENYKVRSPGLRPLVDSLWRHSVACAMGCEWLSKRLRRPDLASETFMSGLLHDIGKLFVLRVMDDLKATDNGFDPPEELICNLLGSMHTDQGFKLLESWNLPDVYCRVVREHHGKEPDEKDTTLLIVRLVDQACNKIGIGLEPAEGVDLVSSTEGQVLRLSDVAAAELEIYLEDAAQISL